MITNTLIEELSDSDTALVCNALTALGLSSEHTYYMDGNICCLSPELPPLVGEAITVKLDSSSANNKANADVYWELLETIHSRELPQVVVVQTLGSNPRRECIMGDGMAKTMKAAGAVGLVTDGGMRDIPGIIDQGFNIFGLGPVVQHTVLQWSSLCEPVSVGGIIVKSGDLIHGDQGGCIVVPEENLTYIVEACNLVLSFEKEAHVLLRKTEIEINKKRTALGVLSAKLETDIKKLLTR